MASRHIRRTFIGEYIPYEVHTVSATKLQLNTVPANRAVLDLGHGTFLGSVVINTLGSSCTLTLYNGNTANVIATITPTAPVSLDFNCVVDGGVWFVYNGTTAGSITLNVLPCAA